MPRIPIALNGFAQVPDEHGGPPRVARLINARVDAPQRIAKSPGSIALPTATVPSGSGLTAPLAYGVTPTGEAYAVSRQALSVNRGASVYGIDDSAWYQASSDPYVVYDEAPRVEDIFDQESYSYNAPGILDLGNGDYVVVAEALKNFAGSGGGSFTYNELHWALVSGGDLKPKSRGSILTWSGTTQRSYPVTAGPYVICWTDTNTLTIWSFSNSTTLGLVAIATVTSSVAWSSGYQLDASYDPILGRLLLIGPLGEFWLLNTTTWAVALTGTLPISGPVQGTIGVAVNSTITPGRTYLAYRTSSSAWFCYIANILDSGIVPVLAVTPLFTSPNAMSDPGFVKWRAQITAWADPTLNLTEGAVAAIYQNALIDDSPTGTGLLMVFSASGVASRLSYGFEMFASIPACKPIVRATDAVAPAKVASFRIWGYQTQGRTLRSAVALSTGYTQYQDGGNDRMYPRLTGVAFRAADPGPAPSELLIGAVNASVVTPTGIGGKSGWLTALCCQKYADLGPNTWANVSVKLVAQADGDQLLTGSTLPDVLKGVPTVDSSIIVSAIPDQFGGRVDMQGAQYPPRNPILVERAIGSTPAAGTYVYLVVREWRDGKGNVHRSPPSDPKTISTADPGTIEITCYDDPWQNRVLETVTKIYRTTNGGSVFYNVSGADGITTPGSTNAGVMFTDGASDASIVSNEILYTQAERGGNSGMLDWWGTPPCRCAWAGADRVIAGGLENPCRFRLSNLFFSTEGISWPEHAAFWGTINEAVTAVASLDVAWLVFGGNSVWLVSGQGPDSFGNGTFEVPRKLSTGVGARNQRSVVETPEGIMFQSSDAQIYLVQRGTYQVVQKSQAIRDAIGKSPASVSVVTLGGNDYSDPTYWIVGAVHDPFANEVWFSDLLSRSWVYQPDFGAWREEVAVSESSKICIYVGSIKVTGYEGPAFIRVPSVGASAGYRVARKSDTNTYTDRLGNIRVMGFHTNDIDLIHGRLKRIWVRMYRQPDEASPKIMPCSVALWFDGSRDTGLPSVPTNPDETRSYPLESAADNTRFMDLEFCPARQKCNQFRFCWYDAPAVGATANLSTYIIGVDVEIEQSPKVRGIRYAAGTPRAT